MATVPHERCVLRLVAITEKDMEITADDKLIWSLGAGRLLTATKDLVMEDTNERSFTAGKTYRVKSMHPIAEPAYVVLVDDQGADHKMEGEHIREFFGTGKKPQNATSHRSAACGASGGLPG